MSVSHTPHTTFSFTAGISFRTPASASSGFSASRAPGLNVVKNTTSSPATGKQAKRRGRGNAPHRSKGKAHARPHGTDTLHPIPEVETPGGSDVRHDKTAAQGTGGVCTRGDEASQRCCTPSLASKVTFADDALDALDALDAMKDAFGCEVEEGDGEVSGG